MKRGPTASGTWVVFQSLLSSNNKTITVDASTIVHSTVLLTGVQPVQDPSMGAPVTHCRLTLHDLAFRFPAPNATVAPRMVRATGSYRIPGASRYACFESTPLPTCAQASLAVGG